MQKNVGCFSQYMCLLSATLFTIFFCLGMKVFEKGRRSRIFKCSLRKLQTSCSQHLFRPFALGKAFTFKKTPTISLALPSKNSLIFFSHSCGFGAFKYRHAQVFVCDLGTVSQWKMSYVNSVSVGQIENIVGNTQTKLRSSK